MGLPLYPKWQKTEKDLHELGINEAKLNTDKYKADFDRTEWGRPGLAALVMKQACDFSEDKLICGMVAERVNIALSWINRGK